MRILITGGFGFIGGRLARYLQEAGQSVVLGTRNIATEAEWISGAQAIQIFWDDAAALETMCQGIDIVVHAAGMNAQDCAADPVAALTFNGVSTARLVAAAARAGVKRLIYISTAHVYSSPLMGAITEETCPRNLHPYATSHLAGEQAVLQTAIYNKLEGIVLRLSNAFGVPAHKDVNCWMLLVNDLCRQAVTTRRLVLSSSGLQCRDFIAMSDVCRVIGRFTQNGVMSNSATVFNVGSGVSQTVLEMAQLIQTRCRQVLEFEPNLQCPTAMADENMNPFSYRSERLKIDDSQVKKDPVEEIDKLLRYCDVQFRNSNE